MGLFDRVQSFQEPVVAERLENLALLQLAAASEEKTVAEARAEFGAIDSTRRETASASSKAV